MHIEPCLFSIDDSRQQQTPRSGVETVDFLKLKDLRVLRCGFSDLFDQCE